MQQPESYVELEVIATIAIIVLTFSTLLVVVPTQLQCTYSPLYSFALFL